jgi:hypothetical protein
LNPDLELGSGGEDTGLSQVVREGIELEGVPEAVPEPGEGPVDELLPKTAEDGLVPLPHLTDELPPRGTIFTK